jgi:hypothetical protein
MEDDDLFNTNRHRGTIRKEILIENLKEYAKTVKDNKLTINGFHGWKGKICSKDTIWRTFGNWENALKEAGIKGWYKRKIYSDDECLEYFEKLWRWRKQVPSRADFVKYNAETGLMFHSSTILNRFGYYKVFCETFSKYKKGIVNKAAFQELKKKQKKKNKLRQAISPRLRAIVLNRDNKTCQDCGANPKENKKAKLHVHHIIPVANGGKTVLDNLITNCDKCNLGKSNVVLDD